MNSMFSFRALTLAFAAVALIGCEKNAVQDITGSLPGARVRFYNFGVNAPQVNFYANGTKVSAVLIATGVESVNGVAYGAVSAGNNGYYSALEPGQYTITGKISATVDKDLVVATQAATLADGKAYSYYISGFYNTTAKTVEGFLVEDGYPQAIDYTVAYVRFVNAISNSQPIALFAKNTTTLAELPVGADVAYKAAGAFTPLPGGIYDLRGRVTGATTDAVVRTAVTFLAGRVYTISARGDITVVSTTATNRPFLDNTANR